MVGLGGLEPPTSPLSGARSSHLSYRPKSCRVQILAWLVSSCAIDRLCGDHLLDETHIGRGTAAFGHFFNRAELYFVAIDVLSERAPDTLGVSWAYNHA